MSRQVTIVTPENIPLTLEPAGIGTRFGALLLDLILWFAMIVVVSIIGGVLSLIFSWTGMGDIALALISIASFLVLFGYFLLFETIWNGQTPGKRVFGLRVVRDGGYPINFYAASLRNLIRIADFLPFGFAVGAVTVFLQPEYKRLGDLVAGTIVIKERPSDPTAAFRTGPTEVIAGQLPATVRNPFDVLSPEELALLRRFAQRRFEMTPDDAERMAYRLIVPLINRLNITFAADAAPRYADLATVLVLVADAREEEMYQQKAA